ncbi:MAG: HAD family phosphatase [Parachlamydiaceae bacterium]
MMLWIRQFQLFLFDFDGLLVNTEEIHYAAYKRMCAQRGVTLDLSFEAYCRMAHYTSTGMRDKLCLEYPELLAQAGSWDRLYAEKKQAVIDLFNEGAVHPMPGVVPLLTALENAAIPRCVVTHSADELVKAICRQNPIFDTIPTWITRGHYSQAKPHPECYLKAINMLAKPGDRVVGFEDSPRGLTALQGTNAHPVLICKIEYPEIPTFVAQGVSHFPSFDAIPHDWNPSSSRK